MEVVLSALQWLWAPVLACSVSAIYWRKGRGLPGWHRFLVSSSGAVIAAIYGAALLVYLAGLARSGLAVPFWCLLSVPIGLSLASVIKFTGSGIHWLQLFNLACLAWTFFIGTMAVTGDWL